MIRFTTAHFTFVVRLDGDEYVSNEKKIFYTNRNVFLIGLYIFKQVFFFWLNSNVYAWI